MGFNPMMYFLALAIFPPTDKGWDVVTNMDQHLAGLILTIIAAIVLAGVCLIVAYRFRYKLLSIFERGVCALFHWLCYRDGRSWSIQWMGHLLLKWPPDLWMYQEIIFETRPDLIIETGTYKGGSALYFANLFDLIGNGRVVTVDITRPPEGWPIHRRIEYLLGSSTSPEILAAIEGRIRPGERVMVVLDSFHSEQHVREELTCYSGFVSPGCYLVVEDTNVNGHPVYRAHGPGPMEAVVDFLKTNPGFVPDKSRERFKITFSPNGWLKRIGDPVAMKQPPRDEVGSTSR
jgi:cephalosporin hydroxylase